MIRRLLFLPFLVFTLPVFAQLNMSLVGHLDYNALHGTMLNDCWGYVDETGIEYAIIGTRSGTSIVSLQDPANPVEVFWKSGVNSVWRDIKVYGDYAYVTTEADEGLLIIDMSELPGSNVLPVTYYYGPNGQNWTSAHNIFIDTTGGWAYICGANRGNGGLIILDIHTDPMNPIEVGVFDDWYCHDAYTQGNLLYGAHISDGFFSIIDITDHTQPILINTQATPSNFSHNIWVTSDDHYAVTTDEVAGAFLALYDVSNPVDISETDRIQSSPGKNIIPHNAFILGDSLIVTSYYTDGITVHDMQRPNNLVQVGGYDTNPLQNSTFNGAWGVYPYLPSGLQIASDITEGMFILQMNVPRAAYYEGLVRDASNLSPLNDVLVTITDNPQTDRTGIDGNYAVGTVTPGVQYVTFSKIAYYPQTIPVNFTNGTLLLDTIDLVPIPPFPLTVIVEDPLGNPVINAQVRITTPEMTQEGPTNGFGERQFQLYYPGLSYITAGKWGYVTHCEQTNLDAATGTLTITLDEGYYDDFSFDFGWTATTDSAVSGLWERGIPYTASDTVSPPTDAFYDCGEYVYVTGNANTINSDFDDVDDGTVFLRSPVFDLTGFTNPRMYLQTWFFCGYGPGAVDDTLKMYLSNGLQEVSLGYFPPNGFDPQWEEREYFLNTFISPTANMQLKLVVSDVGPNINVTEAAIDAFKISDGPILGTADFNTINWSIYPNPATEQLSVDGAVNETYYIFAPDGTIIQSGILRENAETVPLTGLTEGVYFMRIGNQVKRFVKQN